MYKPQHRNSKNSVNRSDAAANQFVPHPFVIQPQTETHQQTPTNDISSAQFTNLSIFSPGHQPPPPPKIQMKLTIGEPGDRYEQEADKVAADVVQRINTPQTPPVQPQAEELGRQPIIQRVSHQGGTNATPDLEASIQRVRGNGESLTPTIREPMEQAFGSDFSAVKVHTDAQSDQMNQSIQAKAFTTGQDIFFRQGAYDPGSRSGQELIAHELTHVVQQNHGTIQRDFNESELAQELKAPDKFNKDNVNVYDALTSDNVQQTLPKSKHFKITATEESDTYRRYKIKYFNWDSTVTDSTSRLQASEGYVNVADVDTGSTKQTAIDEDVYQILPDSAAGIKQEDVFQEGLSDCYLQAALIAVAQKQPQKIFDMITVNEDTVTVRFYMYNNKLPGEHGVYSYHQLTPTPVHVSKSLLMNDDGKLVYGGKLAPGTDLWPAFVQKAWAVVKGGYAASEMGMSGNAIRAITGEGDYGAIQHGSDPSLQWDLYSKMRDALQNNKAVALGTATFAKTGWWKQYLNSKKERPGPDDMPRGDVRVLHGYAVFALDKMGLQEQDFQRSIKNPIIPTVKLTLRDPREPDGNSFTRTLEDVVTHEKFQSVHTG